MQQSLNKSFFQLDVIWRGCVSISVLILIWQLVVMLCHVPPYILPTPLLVAKSLLQYADLIAHESLPTVIETVIGFLCSAIFGILGALLLSYFRPARIWFLPILLISQALPTFAIAPLFVIWFGYGIASKIAITILMLFFPITSAFYDGLKRTCPGYLELAQTMNASKWRILWHIRVPAALPALGSGLRVAATFAPMGAVIGEWVGASHGLGFLILNANARMQIDLMFAALVVLVTATLLFYFLVDLFFKIMVNWQ